MILSSSFDRGPEAWCSYDYHASMVAGNNIFILTTWAAEGGVGNGGYVWADQTRWSCDAPECYFWIHVGGTRWHCKGHPIDIADGRWADEPARFKLVHDEAQWYMSWTKYPEPEGLSEVMSSAESYGFSFVGFKGEVTGRLSLGGFEISKHE